MSCLCSKGALACLLLVYLTSCSSLPKSETTATDGWQFSGNMAIRNADKATSFRLTWEQRGEAYSIELAGPLGQGKVSISGQPGRVSLRQGGQETSAASLEALATEQLRMPLPLSHLGYWVRAMPSPHAHFEVKFNAAGQLAMLSQAGWEITITDYFTDAEELPRRLTFENGNSHGKLVIRQWQNNS